jgi:hypothetical protein
MQEVDAARRLAILRGEPVPPLAIEPAPPSPSLGARDSRPHGERRPQKKRKRAGEDDTDFEMRLANEQVDSGSKAGKELILRRPVEAPLTDRMGHIDLFPQPKVENSISKDLEADRKKSEEIAKRKKDYERDYTVKMSDAAGFKQGLQQPWYSRDGGEDEEAPSKNVWGNEDPRRKEREIKRVVSNDPLAMMKQGAAKVRQVEKDRRPWAEEKERQTRELERAEKERRKRRRKHRDGDDDGGELEGFSLDRDEPKEHKSRHDDSRRREHKHRDRSRDRDRERRHHRRDQLT